MTRAEILWVAAEVAAVAAGDKTEVAPEVVAEVAAVAAGDETEVAAVVRQWQ